MANHDRRLVGWGLCRPRFSLSWRLASGMRSHQNLNLPSASVLISGLGPRKKPERRGLSNAENNLKSKMLVAYSGMAIDKNLPGEGSIQIDKWRGILFEPGNSLEVRSIPFHRKIWNWEPFHSMSLGIRNSMAGGNGGKETPLRGSLRRNL